MDVITEHRLKQLQLQPDGLGGVSAAERGARLNALEAPDFRLPDLSGAQHSLSEHRGKKVLLVAYASW